MIILDKMANYTKEILEYDPSLIIISRTNFDRQDTKTNFIVIDNISNTPVGNFNTFDPENEKQKFTSRFTGSFQILFYGLDALQNAIKWKNLKQSEKSFEIQSFYGINIYNVTAHNNLKIEDGTNYNDLYQIDFKVLYDESTEIDTLRIDVAQTQFINSK